MLYCITVMRKSMHGRLNLLKAITLRNLPPELVRVIRRRAAEKRTSLNRAVLELLQERLGTKGQRLRQPLYHDLDLLAGSWSREEAAAFEQAMRDQRRIDPDVWK